MSWNAERERMDDAIANLMENLIGFTVSETAKHRGTGPFW